jgi:imidazolonepropionase-like amidohydrolase
MKCLHLIKWVILFMFITAPCMLAASDGNFAFLHVNVIPMDQERVLADYTVIVQSGRIIEIGPTASTTVPDWATQIDAAGQYLIPALADMHIHMLGQAWNIMFPPQAQFKPEALDFAKLLFLYVANGVTTVQVMSALPDHLPLRDQINKAEVLGPRLILARMIDGPKKAWPPPISTWVATVEEARQGVLDAKKAGYDTMKVYSFLTQETYDAVLNTAKEVGMSVDGHIPMALSTEYVLKVGQNHIVHSEEVMKHAKGDYSSERIDYFANIIAESDTWITPTLIPSNQLLVIFDDLDKELARPEVRYMHPMALGIWSYLTTNMYLPMPPEHRASIRKGYESFQLPLTQALNKKGVKLMAGTDALLPTVIPGFSLHWELEKLVVAGLTPYEALRTSTTHPMEFLGELDKAGTIEVGKRAELVLLESNPLEKITNTRKIAGVMMQSRWLPKSELQKGLDDVVDFYETLKK